MTELLHLVADFSLALLGVILFLLLLAAKEVGYYVGRRMYRQEDADETVRTNVGLISGSMLALVAFLIAMSLSIANLRYEERRAVVLAEANAIGTAFLRAGAQKSEAGMAMQHLLEKYAEVRTQAVTTAKTTDDSARILARTATLQDEIWTIAGTITRDAPTAVSAQLLASLNETFDLALSQRRAFGSGVPLHVVWLLIWASLLAAAALGFHIGMLGSRRSAMSTLLVLMWASLLVLIADINRAGHGWIHVSADPLIWTVEQLQRSAR